MSTKKDEMERNRDFRYRNFSIELDCPPGFPRPDEILPRALKDTPFTVEDFHNTSRFFGNWIYVLKEGDPGQDALFTEHKPIFQKNITDLYDKGLIRYGSW